VARMSERRLGVARRVMVAVVVMAACGLTPNIAAAAMSWSAPVEIDHTGGISRQAVSCPSSSECVAVGGAGQAVMFNPTSPEAQVRSVQDSIALDAVSCPATTQCTAIDSGGSEVTFDPAMPGAGPEIPPDSFTARPGGFALGAFAAKRSLSCPSVSQCTAMSGGQEVTFDPQSITHTTAATIDPGSDLSELTCPTLSQCTALDDGRQAMTFDPQSPATVTTVVIDSNTSLGLQDLACPSTTQCTAFDSGAEVTFDPTSAAGSTSAIVDDESGVNPFTGRIDSLTCASVVLCTLVDQVGRAVTFDPRSPVPESVTVDPENSLEDIACPVANQCTAVDGSGGEVTFDPSSPGTPQVFADATSNALTGVACATADTCTAVDDVGQEITFNPMSPDAQSSARIDINTSIAAGGYPGFITGVACPSASECVELGGGLGVEMFDPGSGPPGLQVSRANLYASNAVSCPSTAQCTVISGSGETTLTLPPNPLTVPPPPIGIDGSNTIESLACPSVEQCVAVDDAGQELTFDPLAPGNPTPVNLEPAGYALLSVACASSSQCSAVDAGGQEITFDPTAPADRALHVIDSAGLTSVACPSLDLCIAVDASGRVAEGDPQGVADWTLTPIADDPLTSVSCATTLICVAVDATGNAYVAAPAAATAPAQSVATTPPSTNGAATTILPAATKVPAKPELLALAVSEHIGKHAARFVFHTVGAHATLACALVRIPRRGRRRPKPTYTPCGTARRFPNLRAGHYILYARATDAQGLGAAPVTYRFTIK
jgi:hypothetical protein